MNTTDTDTKTISKILLTGVSGSVGRATAKELLAHGYNLRGFDKSPPPASAEWTTDPRFEMVYADITDRLAVLSAADGCDAIVHLAAIPHPEVPNPEDILHTNVAGTGYLLEAAETFGITRFALASTCCAFGFYFALKPFAPDYLPLDEAHPARPHDLYGLSKIMCEQLCAAYTTRTGMTTVALRLTSVHNFDHPRHNEWMRRHLADTSRSSRDFWTYVEMRDCARAFRLALENAPQGTFAPLIISARDAFTTHDIREQVTKHYPALAGDIQNFAPTDALYDTRRAEEHIGFVAQNSWRDVPDFAEVAK